MKTLLYTATVAAVLLLTTASWGQEAVPKGKAAPAKATEPGKAPDLKVGDQMGPPTKAEAEAAKKQAELQKQVEDLQKKLQESEEARKVAEEAAKQAVAAKAATPPAPTPAPAPRAARPAKAAPKRVARKPAAQKARVAVTVKENKDLTIRNLRDQLAKEKGHTAILHASNAGFRAGVEAGKGTVIPQITVHGATATATSYGSTATAKARGGSGSAQPGETVTPPPSKKDGTGDRPKADPKKDQPKASDPNPEAPKNGAEGKGGKTPAPPESKAPAEDKGKTQDEKKKTGVPIGLAAL